MLQLLKKFDCAFDGCNPAGVLTEFYFENHKETAMNTSFGNFRLSEVQFKTQNRLIEAASTSRKLIIGTSMDVIQLLIKVTVEVEQS